MQTRIGFLVWDGQRTALLSVIRDVTEQVQAEQTLRIRYELTSALAQAVTLDDVAQSTVEQLTRLVGATTGHIYIYREKEVTFELLQTRFPQPTEHFLSWQRQTDGTSLFRDVMREQKPQWFSSTQLRTLGDPFKDTFFSPDTDAWMLLPLVVNRYAFGLLSLGFTGHQPFEKREEDFIHSLVDQCAQALERARLSEVAQAMAVLQERQRLAQDLHDSVSQALYTATLLAEALPRLWKQKPEMVFAQLEELHPLLRGTTAEMRKLLFELQPEHIVKSQLSVLLTQLAHAAQARKRIAISVSAREDSPESLPSDVHIVFYRIAQESLNNIVKYADAKKVKLLLKQTDQYTALVIIDNGCGFDTTQLYTGYGLLGMQEHAKSVGATIHIKSTLGKGTRCDTSYPVRHLLNHFNRERITS